MGVWVLLNASAIPFFCTQLTGQVIKSFLLTYLVLDPEQMLKCLVLHLN
jgi:hypothetical protein